MICKSCKYAGNPAVFSSRLTLIIMLAANANTVEMEKSP